MWFQNLELIELLKENFPGNFFYLDDVNKFAAKSEGPNFITDNYKASFIEQEICFSKSTVLCTPTCFLLWLRRVKYEMCSKSEENEKFNKALLQFIRFCRIDIILGRSVVVVVANRFNGPVGTRHKAT